MAANAMVGLAGTLAKAQKRKPSLMEELEAALNLSSWTEDLPLDGWDALDKAVKARSFHLVHAVAEKLLLEMAVEWANLGFPRNREEWHKAKYQQGVSE